MSRFAVIPASAITDKRLSLRELSVLAALGVHTDRNGWCWPSSSRLGEMLGVSGGMVRQAIAALARYGYVEIQPRQRADGGQSSNMIRVLFDTQPPDEEMRVSDATPVSPELTPPVSPELTPLTNPSNGPIERREDLAPTVHSRLAAPKRPAVPVAEIVDLYHQVLPMCPQVRKLTATRRKQIEARWRCGDLPDLDTWRSYFEFCAESKFLTGLTQPANGHKHFVADLEWLSREGNYAKIYERKYHR